MIELKPKPNPKFTLRCDLLPTRKSHADNMNYIHDVIKSAYEDPAPYVYLKDFLKELGFKLGGVKKLDDWRIDKKFFNYHQLLLIGMVNISGDMDYCIYFCQASNYIYKKVYDENHMLSIITLREFREKERQNALNQSYKKYIKRDIEATKEIFKQAMFKET